MKRTCFALTEYTNLRRCVSQEQWKGGPVLCRLRSWRQQPTGGPF